MKVETINFANLDKLIDEHKENIPQKKALLILKSGCTPYRGKDIPKRIAVRVINSAKTNADFLANAFAEEDNNEMFDFHASLSNGLGNVIRICYEEE